MVVFSTPFVLAKPAGQVIFESLGQRAGLLERPIKSVQLLNDAKANWQHRLEGLVIEIEGASLPDAAVDWKIEL